MAQVYSQPITSANNAIHEVSTINMQAPNVLQSAPTFNVTSTITANIPTVILQSTSASTINPHLIQQQCTQNPINTKQNNQYYY